MNVIYVVVFFFQEKLLSFTWLKFDFFWCLVFGFFLSLVHLLW